MSLTVIRPLRLKSRSTTRSFSTLCLWRISRACSRVVPTGTVISSSLVMSSETGSEVRVSKRRSRLVRMPTSLGPTVTGTPLMRNFAMRARASATGASGATVTGSTIMPDSDRFTLSTSAAWASMVMFLWMKPIPPSWARAIARWASVTVSMAAETIGIRSEIVLVRRVDDVHLRGQHVRALRHQQHVVESQRLGQPLFDHLSFPGLNSHGISCTSCRCRTGRGRSGRPSAPRGGWSARRPCRPTPLAAARRGRKPSASTTGR